MTSRVLARLCTLGMFLAAGDHASAQPAAPPPADEVAQLVKLLAGGRPGQVAPAEWNALRTMAFLGVADDPDTAGPMLPVLEQALRDDDPGTAIMAAATLLSVAPTVATSEASGVLLAGLQSDDDEVRHAVNTALSNIKRITPPLTPIYGAALAAGQPDAWALAEALRHLPPERGGEVADALANTLSTPHGRDRQAAARALAGYGPYAAVAVPELRRLLESADAQDRVSAAAALGDIQRPPDAALLPVLAEAFGADDHNVRWQALMAVEKWGAAAVPIVPAVAARLADEDSGVVYAAAKQLGLLGPGAAAALPALRIAATRGLGGNPGAEVLTAIRLIENKPEIDWSRQQPREVLTAALASRDARERLSAVQQLRRRGVDRTWAAPRARAALNDSDVAVRYYASYVLAAIDPPSAPALLPTFREMLYSNVVVNGSNPKILANVALGELGRPGADVLIEALRADDPDTRVNAVHGLEHSNEFPPEAVDALLRLLHDQDEHVRSQALYVLVARKAAPAQMVPMFVRQLTESSAEARRVAAGHLAFYREAAISAIEALRTALRDGDRAVAQAAAGALVAIDPKNAADLLPAAVSRFTAAATAVDVPEPSNEALYELSISAENLGNFGTTARAMAPALMQAFAKVGGVDQVILGVAAVQVDPEVARPILDAFIRALDADSTRADGLWALRALGPLAAPAEAAVARITGDPGAADRELAAEVLLAIRRR